MILPAATPATPARTRRALLLQTATASGAPAIAAIAGVAGVAAVALGCGPAGTAPPAATGRLAPATIEVHHWDKGADDHLWPAWVERFEARHAGVKVQLNRVPGGEYHTKLKVLLSSGTPPDFFFDNAAPDYMYLGVLEALDPYVARDKLNLGALQQSMVNAKRRNGKLMALPNHASVKVWNYNADLYREVGAPDPNEQYDKNRWSWNDFLEVAQKFRLADAAGTVTRWHGSQSDYFNVLPQNKAGFLSADLRTVTIAEPNAIEAFQFMQDVIWKYRIHPGATGTPPAPQGGFFANRLQAGRDSWSTYDTIRKEIAAYPQPFAWDVAPLPYNKAKGTMSGPTGWAIPKDSPRKEHGYALARFITFGLEQQLDVANSLGMPALKEAADKAFAKLTEPRGAKRALLEPFEKGYTSLSERFSFPKWQEFAPVASREITALLRNEKSPREACEAMAAELRALVASIKWD